MSNCLFWSPRIYDYGMVHSSWLIVTSKGPAILQISSTRDVTLTGKVLPPRWSDTDWGKSGWIALFSLVGWTTVEVGDSTGQSGRGRVFLTSMSSPWTLTKASQGPSQVFKVPRCTGVLFADLLSSLPPRWAAAPEGTLGATTLVLLLRKWGLW